MPGNAWICFVSQPHFKWPIFVRWISASVSPSSLSSGSILGPTDSPKVFSFGRNKTCSTLFHDIVGFATAQQHRHTKRNKVLALWCATWQFACMCSQILNTATKLSLPGRSSESAFKAWKSLLLKACRLLDFEGASYLTHGDDLRIGYLYLGMPWMPQQISETIDHHGYLPETSSLSKHQNHRPSTYLFKLSLHWTIATLANLLLYNAISIWYIRAEPLLNM